MNNPPPLRSERKTIYFQCNHCQDMASQSFASFSQGLMSFIDTHAVERVVIDLRQNGGGNSSILLPFINAIRARPSLNQRGKIFVAIDQGTCSSGMLNAVNLQQMTQSILVGEPTGGKPNSCGEVLSFALLNSGLIVNYSTKFFQTVPGDPPSVIPDLLVRLSVDDYLAGRDSRLLAVEENMKVTSSSLSSAGRYRSRYCVRCALLISLFLSTLIVFLNSLADRTPCLAASAQQPAIVVVNAASFANNGAVAPEMIASVFGVFKTQDDQPFVATALPLPTTLGGIQVTVKGVNARLFFTSNSQINFLIPSLTATGAASVVVTNADNTTRTSTIIIAPASPGIFTTRTDGQGTAVAQTTADGVNCLNIFNPDGSERDVDAGAKARPDFLIQSGV